MSVFSIDVIKPENTQIYRDIFSEVKKSRLLGNRGFELCSNTKLQIVLRMYRGTNSSKDSFLFTPFKPISHKFMFKLFSKIYLHEYML